MTVVISSFGQRTEVIGKTKKITKVNFGSGNMNRVNLPPNEIVYIVDADNDYFTIRHNDGYGYVSRSQIKYSQKEINELLSFRDIEPLDKTKIKPPTILNQDYIAKNSVLDLKKIDDPYKLEIDHLRYCLGRYNREVMTGYGLTIAGSVVTIASAFIDDSGIGIAAGSVLSLIGGIVIIDGQKWTKRAYIGPNGIGIRFTF